MPSCLSYPEPSAERQTGFTGAVGTCRLNGTRAEVLTLCRAISFPASRYLPFCGQLDMEIADVSDLFGAEHQLFKSSIGQFQGWGSNL